MSAKEDTATAVPLPLPWQTNEWNGLVSRIDSAVMPHALLIRGSSGVGKEHFLRALIALLLCRQPVQGVACSVCAECHLYRAGTHPDIRWITPLVDDQDDVEDEKAKLKAVKVKPIKVDAIRELIHFLTHTAQRDGKRVAVIYPAEAMNESAANALLKTLEEPGEGVYLLLATHDLSRVSATIRSRCQRIDFLLPPDEITAHWLHQVTGAPSETVKLAMSAGFGRPLLARDLILNGMLQVRLQFLQDVQNIRQQRLDITVKAGEWSKSPDAVLLLEWWADLVSNTVKSAAQLSSMAAWLDFLRILMQARVSLLSGRSNLDARLTWEDLAIRWQQLPI